MDAYIKDEQTFGANNYAPFPVVLTRAEGVYVWDTEGRRYIDMMSAYSAVSHGHSHPKLVKVLTDQAKQLNIVSRAFFTDKLGIFLRRVCELTGMDKAIPMNTGAEAVETAIKTARKWGHKIKKIPENKAEIIVCAGNFHGRTTTVISMSTEPQYRDGFGPFTPGFKVIPYADLDALEKAITPNTAMFLVEPVQGEAGIIVPPAGYLRRAAEICRKNNVLIFCDEVQTGLGRTGKFLASEHEGVIPDGLMLGKALGGGLLPVSMFLARKEVMSVFNPGDHGSTFGGNPLAAAVGLAAVNLLVEENLSAQAAEMGEYLIKSLKKIPSKLIKDVRGKGLLIGVEVDTKFSTREICLKLLKHGVMTKDTHATVLRFAPPLTITREQIDVAVAAVAEALTEEETAKA